MLTNKRADAVMAAAQAQASACGERRVTIVVLDEVGSLFALRRPDESPPAAVTMAMAKARTALEFRAPTFALSELPSLASAFTFPMTQLPGGVPLSTEGQVIGAIGVGGAGDPNVDHQIAHEGASAIAALRGLDQSE